MAEASSILWPIQATTAGFKTCSQDDIDSVGGQVYMALKTEPGTWDWDEEEAFGVADLRGNVSSDYVEARLRACVPAVDVLVEEDRSRYDELKSTLDIEIATTEDQDGVL